MLPLDKLVVGKFSSAFISLLQDLGPLPHDEMLPVSFLVFVFIFYLLRLVFSELITATRCSFSLGGEVPRDGGSRLDTLGLCESIGAFGAQRTSGREGARVARPNHLDFRSVSALLLGRLL